MLPWSFAEDGAADEAALLRLWREKRGELEPDDLSGDLIVQLGVVTEFLNRHWFERNTGQVLTDALTLLFFLLFSHRRILEGADPPKVQAHENNRKPFQRHPMVSRTAAASHP